MIISILNKLKILWCIRNMIFPPGTSPTEKKYQFRPINTNPITISIPIRLICASLCPPLFITFKGYSRHRIIWNLRRIEKSSYRLWKYSKIKYPNMNRPKIGTKRTIDYTLIVRSKKSLHLKILPYLWSVILCWKFPT